MSVCAAPGYLKRHGRPKTLEDLSQHDAVVYGRNGVNKPWRFPDGQGGEQRITVQARLRFDDVETIMDAAVQGAGLAWLPRWLIAEHLRGGRLVEVLETQRPYDNEIYAVWPQSKHLTSKVRAAIDLLVARLPERLTDPSSR